MKLTTRTWKWMVRRWISFWGPAYFQVRLLLVSGSFVITIACENEKSLVIFEPKEQETSSRTEHIQNILQKWLPTNPQVSVLHPGITSWSSKSFNTCQYSQGLPKRQIQIAIAQQIYLVVFHQPIWKICSWNLDHFPNFWGKLPKLRRNSQSWGSWDLLPFLLPRKSSTFFLYCGICLRK